jgi:hypothetical protein
MFHLTSKNQNGAGPKFSVSTFTLAGLVPLIETMRRDYPRHVITIVNNGNGLVHTVMPGRSIDRLADYLS